MSLFLSLTASPPKRPVNALILHAGSKTGRPTWSNPHPGWQGHSGVLGSAAYYCSISEPRAGVGWQGYARDHPFITQYDDGNTEVVSMWVCRSLEDRKSQQAQGLM
ncbi:dual specificity mitogen-activated protein kinase kinase 5 isoform X1 [Tachysurus ichikawai]